MSFQKIQYIWKVARPKDEGVARALMYAAYKTALETDPNPTQVLIRSYIHGTTKTRRGTYKKDAPHITVSVKNPDTERARRHQTSHGYTSSLRSFNVVKVKPTGVETDDALGTAWPADADARPSDTFTGPPALLGPEDGFITFPSEETGE